MGGDSPTRGGQHAGPSEVPAPNLGGLRRFLAAVPGEQEGLGWMVISAIAQVRVWGSSMDPRCNEQREKMAHKGNDSTRSIESCEMCQREGVVNETNFKLERKHPQQQMADLPEF